MHQDFAADTWTAHGDAAFVMQPSTFKYFFEVAQLGSIRRASQTLNVAASAISRQIMRLEHEIGTPLIERLNKGIRLTDAGEILYRHLGESALIQERALGWIEDIKGARRGRVRIATIEGLLGNYLPRVLRHLNEAYPNIQVEIMVVGADLVTNMLRDDMCDIGVVLEPDDISQLSICAELVTDLTATVTPDHPLARRDSVTISDIAAFPVILNSSSFSTRRLVDRAAKRAGCTLSPSIEINSIEGMKFLARAGLGIIFVPAFVVEREQARKELIAIPLMDAEFSKLKLFVLTKQSRRLSPAGARLLNLLVTEFRTAASASDATGSTKKAKTAKR
jgi:DNA-binding transcriptional LysR family regulator